MEGNNKDGEISKSQRQWRVVVGWWCYLYTSQSKGRNQVEEYEEGTCKTNLGVGRGFPGGLVVKNLPANAEDVGSFNPWPRKILHAVGHLSPCTTTTEPMQHSY